MSTSVPDIMEWADRLPSARQQVFGLLRVIVVVIAAMLLWRKTGLETYCTSAIKRSAQAVIDRIEATNVTIMKDKRVSMRRNIRATLKSEVYFSIMIPLVIVAMLPAYCTVKAAGAVLLAMAGMAAFNVVHTVILGYLHYFKIVATTQGSAYLLGTSFLIAPVVMVGGSWAIIDRWQQFVSEKRSRRQLHSVSQKTVHRNAPCPCGSGRKYKKCCGAKG